MGLWEQVKSKAPKKVQQLLDTPVEFIKEQVYEVVAKIILDLTEAAVRLILGLDIIAEFPEDVADLLIALLTPINGLWRSLAIEVNTLAHTLIETTGPVGVFLGVAGIILLTYLRFRVLVAAMGELPGGSSIVDFFNLR